MLDGVLVGLGSFIAIGQLPKLVGLEKPSGDSVAVLVQTVAKIGSWSGNATVVGVSQIDVTGAGPYGGCATPGSGHSCG